MLPGRNEAEMGPANSLHVSAWYSEYNERFDWVYTSLCFAFQKVNYTCDRYNSLDEHHTHFILVDDGSTDKFGKEIELRAKLEKYIGELPEMYQNMHVSSGFDYNC